MATLQQRFTASFAPASLAASKTTQLLLTSASVLALQAVLAAGAANAVTCLTGVTTTTNSSAVAGDVLAGNLVPFTASNFTAVTGVTGQTSGATDNGNPDATACGTNANANGTDASRLRLQ